MNRASTWLIIAFWAMQSSFMPSNSQTFLDYIQQYKDIAIQEMQRTGIPASIKLAQAIQESGAGTSELARQANNHFGIKCHNDWNGPTYQRKDDDYSSMGELVESCFRVYRSAEQSFLEHSEFLKRPRYSALFQLNPTDYRAWAQGLQNAGYATDRSYATRLIDLIERFQLHQYDIKGFRENELPVTLTPAPVVVDNGYYTLNDVKYVFALPYESLEEIAQRTGTAVSNLRNYNENLLNGTLEGNTRIFIQPKRNAYRGRQIYHVVASGETMFDIAQSYGIKLDNLYDRNRMVPGTQPALNEEIKLRGSKVGQTPRLQTQSVASNPEYLFEEPIAPQTLPKPQTPVTPVDPPSSATTPGASPRTEESFDGTDRFNQPQVNPNPPAPTSNVQYHIVKKGDTLWNISQRYNTTVDQLKKRNNLSSNNIRIGMQLYVQ